jgi:small-conductance mechanosensitive channel
MNELHRLDYCRLCTLIIRPSFSFKSTAVWVSDGLLQTLKQIRLSFIPLLLSLLGVFGASWSYPATAQEVQSTDLTTITGQSKDDLTKSVPLEFMNRHIFTIRSESMGYTREERALTIKARITLAMEKGGGDYVSVRPTPEGGRFIELNGLAVFQIRPVDLDPLTGESIDEAAKNAAENLKIAVLDDREQSNPQIMLKGLELILLASVFFYLVCLFLYRLERVINGYFLRWLADYEAELAVAIRPQQAITAAIFFVRLGKWGLLIVASYDWATFSLRQFPYTRPWGESLNSYLIDTLKGILMAIVDTLPGLLVVLIIVLLTRLMSGLLKAFFARIESGEVTVPWMAVDTAKPTRKLTQAILWLFALAMAYPYLPGSNTQAFKGLSVFVGLMLSIGGSGVVGQAASGLIMIYSRVLREGEFVKIGQIEGLVNKVGFFSTKIITATGEEINVPNSLIGSSTTINSSRLSEGNGLVVHTGVTIGYNTPWRQVHAMLMQAAENTPGIRSIPKPFVTQTALSDFYVEYLLCVQVDHPEIRRVTLSALHGNIQDVFNEFGVQIMSPHYEYDPLQKVWVPKEQWFEAPTEQSINGKSV